MKSKYAKALIGCLLLGLLLYMVDHTALAAAFGEITVEAIAILLVLSAALVGASAVKWRLLLTEISADSSAPGVGRLSALYLVGYFFNLVFPSYVGGDVVRSYYAGKHVGQHEAAAATILERYSGLIAMLILALIMMFLSPLISVEIRYVVAAISLGVAGLTVIALSPSLAKLVTRLPKGEFLSQSITKVQAGFRLAAAKPRLLLIALVLSFLFHSLTVLNTIAAAYAVGWTTVPVVDLFVVLPIILLVGAVPISPQGLGLQEGAFVFFLRGLGASEAEALALALILRAKGYVLALVGGIIFLSEKKS